MVDKTLDISEDAQWLLPSEQVIPALLPCTEGVQKRVVRISLWDTHLCCSTSPSSKWAELPHRHASPKALGWLGCPTPGSH